MQPLGCRRSSPSSQLSAACLRVTSRSTSRQAAGLSRPPPARLGPHSVSKSFPCQLASLLCIYPFLARYDIVTHPVPRGAGPVQAPAPRHCRERVGCRLGDVRSADERHFQAGHPVRRRRQGYPPGESRRLRTCASPPLLSPLFPLPPHPFSLLPTAARADEVNTVVSLPDIGGFVGERVHFEVRAVSQFGAPQPAGGERVTVDVCDGDTVLFPAAVADQGDGRCATRRAHSLSARTVRLRSHVRNEPGLLCVAAEREPLSAALRAGTCASSSRRWPAPTSCASSSTGGPSRRIPSPSSSAAVRRETYLRKDLLAPLTLLTM